MAATEGDQVMTLDTLYQFMVKEFGGLKGELTKIREDLGKEKEKREAVEARVKTVEDDQVQLKNQIKSLQDDVIFLKENVNDREQYARSWSIRITGLSVSKEDEVKLGKDSAVMKTAYDRVLKPILNAAKAKGDITTVPTAYHLLLENGHYIYRRGGDKGAAGGPREGGGEGVQHQIPPIIVRFCSRHLRNVVLRNKKNATPKPTDAEVAMGAKRYGIFEDLTVKNFKLLRSAIEEKRILKCWTIDGKLRFITDQEPERVRSLGDCRTVAEFFKPK